MAEQWTVYMIRAENGKLYTGITTDLERRFHEHAGRGKGARFFHTAAPEAVVFTETHIDRSSATRRELQIKKMTRRQKLAMIRLLVEQ